MLEKVAELIRSQLHISESTVISEDTNFKEDLRADSFELMELIMAVEDEYGIKVEDEDLEKFELKRSSAPSRSTPKSSRTTDALTKRIRRFPSVSANASRL